MITFFLNHFVLLFRENIWFLGDVEYLGRNDIYDMSTNDTLCPEKSNSWTLSTGELVENMILNCGAKMSRSLEQNDTTDDESLWLKRMTEKEVENLIQFSTVENLCGRRPWTNVENWEILYPDGDVQSFSGKNKNNMLGTNMLYTEIMVRKVEFCSFFTSEIK